MAVFSRAIVHLYLLVPLWTILPFCLPSPTLSKEPSRLVVVIYPDESDNAPGTIAVNRAIRSKFASNPSSRIEVLSEYVNASRSRDIDYMKTQVSLLRQKYSSRKIDLVIAGLSSGLDFAVAHREELFPGVPIVFVAVDQREINSRRPPPDVVGVPVWMDLAGTLDLALKLHPKTQRAFVVSGDAPFDHAWQLEARRAFRPFEDRVEFTYLAGLPMNELVARLANLPDRSIIYYLSIQRDGAGVPMIPAEALERIALESNAPIYGHIDTYVGRGIVGGHVFSFEAAGLNAATLGLHILHGGKAGEIHIPSSENNSFQFDARQLRRWDINEAELPDGSTIHFKETSFWEMYRGYIVGAVSLILLQMMLITGLIIQHIKRRRADRRFREVIEASPTGMLVVGQDGKIVLANAQIEKLFGYQRTELLGDSVDVLIPAPLRDQQTSWGNEFFGRSTLTPMGGGRDLLGRRKDGSEFPVEIRISPIRTVQGLCALASVIDVTERKRFEATILSSQQELQALAGKLLDAHESERRRIARELHDDLNQSLALLSVDLELLGQMPPDSISKFSSRVQQLSGRVRELSSSVHNLSHRLHPSKLEQLGLTASLRGLCKELMQSHGLVIHFVESQVPASLPEDASLCLYRIAHEALRNVIKHSGADRAHVELAGMSSSIRLQVVDQGVGFDPTAAQRTGGLGLVSMRERLHQVGGEIEIDSFPSGGTRVVTIVPYVNGHNGSNA